MHTYRNYHIVAVVVIASSASWVHAQEPSPPALIVRSGGDTIVRANAARPFVAALEVIAERYGWKVDYEDPVYSSEETKDATIPEWRKQHPESKGVLIPSGGEFVANLGRISPTNPNERSVLERLIQVYNSGANPGYFRLVETPSHRFCGRGSSRSSSSGKSIQIFDEMIQAKPDQQPALDALRELMLHCGADGKIPIEPGIIPNNSLNQTTIKGNKGPFSCRERLGRILNAMSSNLIYDLFYDIGLKTYYLSIVPAHRVIIGPDGKEVRVPLEMLAR